MINNSSEHYNQWPAVIIWIILYGLILIFMPFYKKCGRKPRGMYLSFVIAFALEMFGIPFSLYIVNWLMGIMLPEGFFWGHTLINQIGHWGMYIGILFMLVGLILIISGWRRIYKEYWSRDKGQGNLVTEGIYNYIRHPQYTGLFFITLGMLLEWATIPLLVMFPLIFINYIRLAYKEEMDMAQEFGADYEEYRKKTGMFFPKILNK